MIHHVHNDVYNTCVQCIVHICTLWCIFTYIYEDTVNVDSPSSVSLLVGSVSRDTFGWRSMAELHIGPSMHDVSTCSVHIVGPKYVQILRFSKSRVAQEKCPCATFQWQGWRSRLHQELVDIFHLLVYMFYPLGHIPTSRLLVIRSHTWLTRDGPLQLRQNPTLQRRPVEPICGSFWTLFLYIVLLVTSSFWMLLVYE